MQTPKETIDLELGEFFESCPRAALALSGGVDSAYLLYAAVRHGADVRPYYVKSAFQPRFELADAERLCRELKVAITVLEEDILADPAVAENPEDRCYHCKKKLFSAIAIAAGRDGRSLLLDGTNASDKACDRPGMRALQELSVRSPLRECGLTKESIRRLSRSAGLFTWNKPAYACLATRIPAGTAITADKLARTEAAEDFLFSLGFTDFRVRMLGAAARLQLPAAQFPKLLAHREEVLAGLKRFYDHIFLDLEARP